MPSRQERQEIFDQINEVKAELSNVFSSINEVNSELREIWERKKVEQHALNRHYRKANKAETGFTFQGQGTERALMSLEETERSLKGRKERLYERKSELISKKQELWNRLNSGRTGG